MKPRITSARYSRFRAGEGRPSLWLAVPLAIMLAGAALFGVTNAASSVASSREAAAVANDLNTLVTTTHAAKTAQTGPTPGSELEAGLAILQLEPSIGALETVGTNSMTANVRVAFEQVEQDVAAGQQAIVTGQSDAAQVNATVGASNQALSDAIETARDALQDDAVDARRWFTLLTGAIFAITGLSVAGLILLAGIQRNTTDLTRRHLEAHFRAMTKYSGDVISLVDRTGTVQAQSASLLRLLGRSDHGLIGRPLADIVQADDRPRLAELLQAALKRTGEPAHGRIALSHADGSIRIADVTAVSPIDQPELEGILLTCRSVADAGAGPAEAPAVTTIPLQHPVSGLLTEALFRDRLAHSLSRSTRSAAPVALLVIELGGERAFDGLSDDAQASILRAISGRLERTIHGGDTVAHLHGLEFAVILEDTDLEAARVISHRIFEQLYPPVAHMNGRIRLTPRIGIAVKTDPRDNVDTLLTDARTALSGTGADEQSEAATSLPGDRAAGITEPRTAVSAAPDAVPAGPLETPRSLLSSFLAESPIARLESAAMPLDGEGGFEMQFLPVLTLGTGEVVELEAMARWRHPERGLVPVEHSGRLDAATAWMVEQACRLAPTLPCTRAGHPVRISVNISPLTPLDDVLVDIVANSLLKNELEPASLQLDIAAHALDAAGGGSALVTLGQLRELGVRLVLVGAGADATRPPDFDRLPVQGVKLDRSVVTLLGGSADRRSLVRSLIERTRANGVTVTGVGVETLEQVERLWELGVDSGQGPLFFRPIAMAQLPALFASEPTMVAAD